MGEPHPADLCVHAGTTIAITLRSAPGYAWTKAQTSAPVVVSVATHATGDTATATAHAIKPGRAELRSTVSFTGDPYGPPTLLWRLIIDVIP
jgi:hypothetical protein